MNGRPRQHAAYASAIGALIFASAYSAYILHSATEANLTTGTWLLLIARTTVEVVASAYGIAFLISAVAFLLMREPHVRSPLTGATAPPIGIIYLCCDDADWSALESLTCLAYDGLLHVIIHDDSRNAAARHAVDRMAAHLAQARDWQVRVLRRPHKTGGKAGAVNYALEQSAHDYEYFLLCDNDSTVLDPDTIDRALRHLEEAGTVAGVQFRSVPVADPGYCRANRRLAESIGAFHAFLAPASRFGWMPFIGHNALLRTRAVQQVGGLTPDFFSDDLDLTVRLNLAGFRITYAPEIEMGEKHPPSYTAFRKRSYKWAYGCVQTLRTHWWRVLTAPQFSFAEKLSFFQFASFYCLQSLLLAYLCFVLLIVPSDGIAAYAPALIPSVITGTVLVVMVYAPLLSFYVKARANRRRGWLTTVALCGLVYGGTDFSVVRGVTDALRRKRRAWIPTNGVPATAVDGTLFAEAAFGLLLLIVPIIYLPELLYLPCWFLFAGKFLFGPALSLLYRDHPNAAMAIDTIDPARRAVRLDGDARGTLDRIAAS